MVTGRRRGRDYALRERPDQSAVGRPSRAQARIEAPSGVSPRAQKPVGSSTLAASEGRIPPRQPSPSAMHQAVADGSSPIKPRNGLPGAGRTCSQARAGRPQRVRLCLENDCGAWELPHADTDFLTGCRAGWLTTMTPADGCDVILGTACGCSGELDLRRCTPPARKSTSTSSTCRGRTVAPADLPARRGGRGGQ